MKNLIVVLLFVLVSLVCCGKGKNQKVELSTPTPVAQEQVNRINFSEMQSTCSRNQGNLIVTCRPETDEFAWDISKTILQLIKLVKVQLIKLGKNLEGKLYQNSDSEVENYKALIKVYEKLIVGYEEKIKILEAMGKKDEQELTEFKKKEVVK